MNKVVVSVIIPTFDRASFIEECLESILAQQTEHRFEIIVVDDGSRDSTPEILASYKNINVIRQKNRGVSSARNVGIVNARGEYIAFCDSDDLWQPAKLATQLGFFHSTPEALVCYTDEIWIRNGRRVNPCKHHRKVSGWIFEKSLQLCIVSPSSVMMHRSFFEKVGLFDEALPACEDYDLWLRASLVLPFYFIPQPLIIKRGGHEQLSKKYWGMDRFRVAAILKCLRMPLSDPQEVFQHIQHCNFAQEQGATSAHSLSSVSEEPTQSLSKRASWDAEKLSKVRLTASQREQAELMLKKKCAILANGARKRGRELEARHYMRIIANLPSTNDSRRH